MRSLLVLVTAVALVAVGALLAGGCPRKADDVAGVEPVARTASATDEPADEGAPAAATDASDSSVDWTWDKDTPIDPASIPEVPAAGSCHGEPFTVAHAIIEEDKNEETGTSTWDLRFLDTKPEAGDEANKYVGDRFLEVTVPEAGEGVTLEVPYGSEEWKIGNTWFWYKTPTPDTQDGVNANPGRNAALYLEFTEWDETPSAANDRIIGTAKGKIAVGSEMFAGRDVCWLAGLFEAVIVGQRGSGR